MYYFFLLYFLMNISFLIFFKKISLLLKMYKLPNKDSIHKKKTPIIGGFIIYLNLIFFFIFYIFNQDTQNIFESILKFDAKQIILFFVSITLVFLIGLYDDIYHASPNIRLLLFFFIFYSLLTLDTSLIIKKINFLNYEIGLGNYSIMFTILCIITFVNAFNMFDGFDGQVAIYSIFAFSLFAYFEKSFLIIIIFYILPLNFLLFLNFFGKCFLGNNGSYTLGYVISYFLIKNYNLQITTLDWILIICALPIFELFRLFIVRIFNGRNPFSGDLNHIHHLLFLNFTKIQVQIIVPIIYCMPIFLILIGFSKYLSLIFLLFLYILIIFLLKKKIISAK